MDGWITIGTNLSTDKFDKQIVSLEKKMKKAEEKKFSLETDITFKQSGLDEQRKKVKQLEKDMKELKKIENDGIDKNFLDFKILASKYGSNTQDFSSDILSKQLEKATAQEEKLSMKLDEVKQKHLSINEQVKEYKQQIEGIKLQKQQSDLEKMKSGFKDMGKSIQSAIGKIAKLALGIFAVRTAVSMLRRASSELATYDPQYAANLEYIRYVLTQAIAPVLKGIVQLAMQLLQLINMIVNSLFGINLFANGSAESFRKMKSSAGGISKAVKEIRKQLAGFDEINILTDQSDTGTGVGAGGVGMPSMDLSKLQGEPPAWMKWIIDNGKLLLSILAGIAGAIATIKVGKLLKSLGLITKLPLKTVSGIGLAIGGIVYGVMSLLEYLKDPRWETFGGIFEGLGVAILGVGLAISSLPVAIAGVAILIHGIIMKNWDKIKATWQKGIDWIWQKGEDVQSFLEEKLDWLPRKWGAVGQIIKGLIQGAVLFITSIIGSAMETALNIFDKIYGGIRKVVDGIILMFRGDFFEGIKLVGQGIFDIFIGVWMGIYRKFIWVWETILNMFSRGGQIFSGIQEGIVSIFKTIVNFLIRGINKVISIPFNKLNGVLNSIKGIDIMGAKPFGGLWGWNPVPVPQIPQLKVGGIINMPNKGTMLGGMAIGGEAGREGVVPLTDQQAMAQLGAEIGRNVVINLTNITSMNGRTLSREIKRITGQQDFAYNT